MYSINRIQLLGNITSDARVFNAVTSISVATNHTTIDKQGNKQDFADYHNCVAFGKLADYVAQLKKGQKVFVEGRMQNSTYEKDGQKIKTSQVVIQTIQAIETKKRWDDFSDLPAGGKAEEISFDDIPF